MIAAATLYPIVPARQSALQEGSTGLLPQITDRLDSPLNENAKSLRGASRLPLCIAAF